MSGPGPRDGAPTIRSSPRREIRRRRLRHSHRCWGHLIAAPLWPLHGVNLGTLLRTCDAVGACLAAPPWPWVDRALATGDTLRRPACVHRIADPLHWLTAERAKVTRVVGVELADEAVELPMIGTGASLNVAVAGSLVLYKLAGLV